MTAPIKLKRDVDVVQIPYGDKLRLPAGVEVRMHQVLGGNFTVQTEHGMLVRVDAGDADALGFAVPKQADAAAGEAKTDKQTVEKKVWDELRTCFDPEIPVNIVELGLIYECKLVPFPAGGHHADVKMTLTAPGCGMGDVLKRDIEEKLKRIPGVADAHIEVVWEPPWHMGMMSEAAKLQLGMM